jgi:flagellar hook-length control protein FliK
VEAFSNAVVRIATEQISEATLTMNPNELGNISVRIGLEGSNVSIGFTAESNEVRQAVNASLPVLQEMLAQAGLSLGQSSISQENPREQASLLPQSTAAPSAREVAAPSTTPNAPTSRRALNGRIDLFA